MIEDKKLGIKMAESKTEAAWYEAEDQYKQVIEQLKRRVKRTESDLKLSAREVHAKFIDGARKQIKEDKLSIKINKEFLEFCRSKLKKS